MHWHLFAVCATEQPGSFGAQHANDPARARRIQRELAADRYEHVGEVTLWDALHAPEDAMFVGAYPGGVLVCHADLAGALIHGNAWSRVTGSLRSDFRERVLKLYPSGEVMALALHCVARLWGFAAYRQGQRIRTAAGSAQEGVFADGGRPLPEEVQVLARTPLEQLNEAGAGEELVLAASARMFGCGIDRLAGTGPTLSYFRRR
ncbi:hypothetical protein IP92_03778 [Pseudoduganella flava]|uniref:Uncharacterized protein n=1 Tax=Pseudoduganella flava TaxID=871742 RepID=A0A562PMH8_9BURK|nr:hypothetical protein [Pseudoduganella flava]QGZ40921.1 hypothetical protein GO485_18830 [Pseudoduganella flava]TWI45400.1 hypothetical protein IP92_03778 [Pseudoduganella flava]